MGVTRTLTFQTFFGPGLAMASLALVAAIFWPTFSNLLALGRETDLTSNSALVILVSLILIWNLRAELVHLPIRPCLWGLAGLICIGFAWLAGELIFTRVLTQFAVLAMFPMAILTLLGTRWVEKLAFPFFLLIFAVPFWSPIVPTLVKWSAGFAELAIGASGVPVYRDGAHFIVPTGSWSIADTCSGVAFLSTSLLLGVLYAWTAYCSTTKRVVFIAGAAVIGVVGNGIRVYLTIMIAHLSNNRFLRDDHYMFGWFLFAIFLFSFCWLGWRFRDANEASEGEAKSNGVVNDTTPSNSSTAKPIVLSAISIAVFLVLIFWPIAKSTLLTSSASKGKSVPEISARNGWVRRDTPSIDWKPDVRNPSRIAIQSFEKNGRRIDVFFGTYENESWDSKLVSASNRLASLDDPNWSLADRGAASANLSSAALEVKSGIILHGTQKVLAWHWYWVGSRPTGSDARAKLEQLRMRLQGVQSSGTWVAIYTDASDSTGTAALALGDFAQEMGESMQNVITRTREE
ncbi:MAG: exosortase A [Usitatibacteraceae bacterium]